MAHSALKVLVGFAGAWFDLSGAWGAVSLGFLFLLRVNIGHKGLRTNIMGP